MIDLPYLTEAQAKIYLLLWTTIMNNERAKIFFHTRLSGKSTLLLALEDSFKSVRQDPPNNQINPYLE